jgi:hypothetical protein
MKKIILKYLLMNKFLIITIFIAIPIISWAQDEEFKTIFHNNHGGKLKISGFGAPVMNFTVIDNEFALMMGGGCGIIVGNAFFGGYGIGKTNEIPYKNDNDNNLGFGHGGFWFGYTFFPKRAIHLALSSQIGWGAVSKKKKLPEGNQENIVSYAITVITPIVEAEYNISRYFKIGTGVTWSYVSGKRISNTPYTSSDFSNPSLFLSFNFGWFD